MAYEPVLPHPPRTPALPAVRRIGIEDLRASLRRGFDDFRAMPSHVVFIGLIYPIVGLILARFMFGLDLLPILFPLAAGFALIGPFAAIGLYEMSRRREQGRDVSWRHALDVFSARGFPGILAVGFLLMVLFLIWLAIAHAIYVAHFGYAQPVSLVGFIYDVLTTATGWQMMVLGNAVGFLFAVTALTLSVVSFPMLLDRHVPATVAMATSVRAVLANPVPMAAWGLIVAGLLALGSIPFLFGLAVVVPVLGHATWHLYRRLVPADGAM